MYRPSGLSSVSSTQQLSGQGSSWRRGRWFLGLVTLAGFAIVPLSLAVVPPPDGGYPGGNTAEGRQALLSLTTGTQNTAVGFRALFANTTANSNTAIGFSAMLGNTTGLGNTALGSTALAGNTTGGGNTASGSTALTSNTTGGSNTAHGASALASNTTGSNNTALGANALLNNTTGTINTATGHQALLSNTTGAGNTANGVNALGDNTTGFANTVIGANALLSNTTGTNNTASGEDSLQNNTTGSENTADGQDALINNTTGSNNIAVGSAAGSALTTGSQNIDIGNVGVAGEGNTIRIGTTGVHTNAYLAGVDGVILPSGTSVFVDASGHLGTIVSSKRYKQEIKPMEKASEAVLKLQPVSFRYLKSYDPSGIPQFGLVAEEVAKVNPDLVAWDKEGKPQTVRYEAVNSMLLNEFLKAHRKVEALEATVAKLQTTIEKVSARLEAADSTARLVENR